MELNNAEIKDALDGRMVTSVDLHPTQDGDRLVITCSGGKRIDIRADRLYIGD